MGSRFGRMVALGAAVTLAGCSAGEPEETAAPARDRAPQQDQLARTSPAEARRALFGEWEILTINGRAPAYNQMQLLFADDWWHMQSQCIWSSGDYRIAENAFDFSAILRAFENYDPATGFPRAMCARGLSPSEELVPQILSGTRSFTLADDRLTISSDIGAIVARRLPETDVQTSGLIDFDAVQAWGAWKVVDIGNRSLDDAEMIITSERLTLRLGCAYRQWLRPIDESGMFSAMVRRRPFADGCERDLDAAEEDLIEALDRLAFTYTDRRDGRIAQVGGEGIRLTR